MYALPKGTAMRDYREERKRSDFVASVDEGNVQSRDAVCIRRESTLVVVV